jgi:hypothetical protein
VPSAVVLVVLVVLIVDPAAAFHNTRVPGGCGGLALCPRERCHVGEVVVAALGVGAEGPGDVEVSALIILNNLGAWFIALAWNSGSVNAARVPTLA